MKRALLFLLIILTLCGCSKKQEDTPEPVESPEVTLSPTPTPSPSPTPIPTPTPTPTPSGINPLNGLPLDDEHLKRRPLAVMYNILKPALPVHGITHADLLYEALAEGGITRIVGMFTNPSLVPQIGTVRSTRAYYLDIAQGHDAILMHAGGSQEALDLIKSRKLFTLDGIATYPFFFRDKQRVKSAGLEHSMFAVGADVESYLTQTTKNRITYNEGYDPYSLSFADMALPEGDVCAKNVSVRFSSYKTGVFDYDENDGYYYVSQYGKPFIDGENNEQLRVKNILILYTKVTNTGDKDGHLITVMTGTGKGMFICGGKAEEIKWSKDKPDAPFIYTQTDGKPLKLSAGVSYINIVPTNAEIKME